MTYGNCYEIYLVAPRNRELKCPPDVFTSLRAAKDHAQAMCTKTLDFAVYHACLVGQMVQDEPRWVEAVGIADPAPETEGGK